ncbi:peptide ABC transporter substrate-binding protein [soil metagenome]
MKNWVLGCFAVALFGAGCGDGAPKSETASATTPAISKLLKLNLGNEPKTFDPTLMTDVVGGITMQGLMEGLVEVNAEGKEQPRAAESWSHDEKSMTWTFKLRPGMKWQNGDPVTANDFVFATERMCTPATGAEYASYTYNFLKGGKDYYKAGGMKDGAHFDGIKAVDDLTLEYNMQNPTPYFISVLQLASWLPLNKNTLTKYGSNWANSEKTFNGNGPFKLTAFKSKDVIILDKSDSYWDRDSIFWDRVQLYMIESENTEVDAFRTGALDVTIGLAIPMLDEWRNKPEFHNFKFFGTQYIGFNNAIEPFKDSRVKIAFSKAIDRKRLVDKVTRRSETIALGIIPEPLASPQGDDYRDHAGNPGYDFDPAGAKALLKEAGYGPDNPFPSVEYLYDSSDENKTVAEQLQAMWHETLGVDVKLQNVEWGVKLSRTPKGDFQIARLNWYGDYVDPMTFMELYESSSTQNSPQYRNPKYDELVENARMETDPVQREKDFIAAEKILIHDDCAIAPLYYIQRPMLIREGIEGIERVPTGGLLYVRAKRTK